jgi:hypothetical protein
MIHVVENPAALHDVASQDTEVERRIVALLDGYHISSLRRVRIQARDRAITVSGEVNTFYARQILQHAVQRVGADYRIDNQVRVSPARPAHPTSLPIATSFTNGRETAPVSNPR